jgi:hypothetical protein
MAGCQIFCPQPDKNSRFLLRVTEARVLIVVDSRSSPEFRRCRVNDADFIVFSVCPISRQE